MYNRHGLHAASMSFMQYNVTLLEKAGPIVFIGSCVQGFILHA